MLSKELETEIQNLKANQELKNREELESIFNNMNLNNRPFKSIKEGTKTIELRLNDEKRSLLKVGDEIEFTNRDTNEKLSVDIINLYKYPSFKELYKQFNKIEMGYAEDEPAESKDMEAYYSK